MTLPGSYTAGQAGYVLANAGGSSISWEDLASSHNTAGTMGAKINSAASAGDPWATSLPGSYAAGSAGKIVGSLNPANVTIVSPVSQAGNKITARAGDTWSIAISGLGDISSRSKLWFSINQAGAADSAAKAFVEESAGLTVVNGAPYATTTDGSVHVDDATAGDITITIKSVATAQLSGTTSWAIKELKSDGTAVTLSSGSFIIAKPGIEAIQ